MFSEVNNGRIFATTALSNYDVDEHVGDSVGGGDGGEIHI